MLSRSRGGNQTDLQNLPYIFTRKYKTDDARLLDWKCLIGKKSINVSSVWKDGTVKVRLGYLGVSGKVVNGNFEMNTTFDIVLLEESELIFYKK